MPFRATLYYGLAENLRHGRPEHAGQLSQVIGSSIE